MQHYTGKQLPDKCYHSDLMAAMIANVSDDIKHYMQNLGCDYAEAKRRVMQKSCAGAGVWRAIDAQYVKAV